MLDEERLDFAAQVLAEFPKITTEVAGAIWAKMKKHSRTVAVEAVQRHRYAKGLYESIPEPDAIGIIAAQIVAQHAASVAVPYGQTVEDVMACRAAAKKLEATRKAAVELVGDLCRLNPAELERLKARAIARVGGAVAERMATRDPRQCPPLAMMIAEESGRMPEGK